MSPDTALFVIRVCVVLLVEVGAIFALVALFRCLGKRCRVSSITKEEEASIVECFYRAITKVHTTTFIDKNTASIMSEFGEGDEKEAPYAVFTVTRSRFGREYITGLRFHRNSEEGTIFYSNLKIRVKANIIRDAHVQDAHEKSLRLLAFERVVKERTPDITRSGC